MPKFVAGSYASLEDAIHALNGMIKKGYSKEDIMFVTSESKKSELSPDVTVNISTDTSNEALRNHKEDIESGKLVALVEENANSNDGRKTGAANFEADSPAENSATSPDLNSNATTDSALKGDSTSGNNPDATNEAKPRSSHTKDNHGSTSDGL